MNERTTQDYEEAAQIFRRYIRDWTLYLYRRYMPIRRFFILDWWRLVMDRQEEIETKTKG